MASQIKSESVAALSITQANPVQQLAHFAEAHLDMSPDIALEWQKIQRGNMGTYGQDACAWVPATPSAEPHRPARAFL